MQNHRPVQRIKVVIYCKKCGEKFVLKGRKEQGRLHTGFQQCVCDNHDDFEYVIQDHV
jgi:hypothetical protein